MKWTEWMALGLLLSFVRITKTASISWKRIPRAVIRPIGCHDKHSGEKGICMFAFNCVRANGTHLSICRDGYYIGSCCRLPHPSTEDPAVVSELSNNDIGSFTTRPSSVPPRISMVTSVVTSLDMEEAERTEFPTTVFKKPTTVSHTPSDIEWIALDATSQTPGTVNDDHLVDGIVDILLNDTQSNFHVTLGISPTQPTTINGMISTPIRITSPGNTIPPIRRPVDISTTSISRPTTETANEVHETYLTTRKWASVTRPTRPTTNKRTTSTTTTTTTTTTASTTTTTTTTPPPTTTTTTTTTTAAPTTEATTETQTEMQTETTSEDPNVTTEINLASADFRQICGRTFYQNVPTSRIVGGKKAEFGKWPWQVSLRQWKRNTFQHKCGAALVNENWAITAAHCVDNVPVEHLLIRVGEFDIKKEEEPLPYEERRVQIIAKHPDFNPRNFENDLALVRFYEPVTFQMNIIPICIPSDDSNYINDTAYVTGWGRLYEDGPLPDVLYEAQIPIISNSECEKLYRRAGYIESIPEIFICAGRPGGGVDSCEGDSGGPMVVRLPNKRWVLAGVISWGIGCAEPYQPGVYTRVSRFREWINAILVF